MLDIFIAIFMVLTISSLAFVMIKSAKNMS